MRSRDSYIVYKVAGGGCRQGNIMPASDFSFDGIHVFLTYPQCNLDREQLRDILVPKSGATKYLIGRERHEDGNYHLHVYLHFGRRRRFVGADAFDVDGHHPNVQKPRSAGSVIAYCCKEDTEPLANFDYQAGIPREGWSDILDQSGCKREFLEAVRRRFPRDYVLNLGRLLEFCEWRFGRDETPYVGRARSEFREPDALSDWVGTNLVEVRIYPAHAYIGTLAGGPQSPP